MLLFLTGGLQNPFAFLFLGPVLLSATALPPRFTLTLGGFAVALRDGPGFRALPVAVGQRGPVAAAADLHDGGLALHSARDRIYRRLRLADRGRSHGSFRDALASTELVLAREQHLSQLDGLAAAAAHELGTPLSTISVIAKELERAIAPNAPHGDDVRLLREQATRCRDILAKLTELSASGEPFDRMPLTALIEEVVAPHRHFGVTIDVSAPENRSAEPVGARNPAILYGLGNLLENAVDFARDRVSVDAKWNDDAVEVTITDDGPGFAPEIMGRIGEPYVTSRPGHPHDTGDEPVGLGLGFFIAKTLLERAGATVSFQNQAQPDRGAVVRLRWSRPDFERRSSFAAA